MNVQTQSSFTPLLLAPTQYRVSASLFVILEPAPIVEVPDIRPSSLGLMDEFEQEAA